MDTETSRQWRMRGLRLVTQDSRNRIFTGEIESAGGRIVALGDALPPARPGVDLLDRTGHVAFPGFIQGHLHLCQTLMRGLADGLTLDRWLTERIWPLEAAHDPDSLGASARLGLAEAVLAGATTVVDMGTVRHTEAIAAAAESSGLRVILSKALMDCGNGVPAGLRQEAAVALREALGLHDVWHGAADGRLQVALAPRFALSVSAGLWAEIAAEARARGARVHTHVSETPWENETCRALHGASPIALLDRLGVLRARTILVHAVWVEPEERRLLAERGAGVVHCPGSNAKLGSGIADVAALRQAGLAVGLGSDGAACNDTLSVPAEMRLAVQLQALRNGPGALGVEDALAMATREGARAVGLEEAVGSLTVGRRADLVLFREEDLAWAPGASPAHALLHAPPGARPCEVVVDGEILVRDGVLVREDLAALRHSAARERIRLLDRAQLR